jgi:hypothetical protein
MDVERTSSDLTDWDLFVMRHRSLPNVAIHFVSFLLFWLSPLLAYTFSAWWLIGFFGSGLVGTFGHFVFKDGRVDAREATSSLQVIHFSSLMAFFFVQGRWPSEIARAELRFSDYQNGHIGSVAHPSMHAKLEIQA